MGRSAKPPRKTLRSFALDARAQGTLRRFVADWIWPRWREIALAFAFTSCLAATTGGYPLIIKHSFDSLMRADSGALPWVLIAIVVVTTARSIFLYLHQVTAARIVMRMTTDIQEAAFAHLINADFARLTRETTGHLVSRLTNDLTFVQQAAQVCQILHLDFGGITLDVLGIGVKLSPISLDLTLSGLLGNLLCGLLGALGGGAPAQAQAAQLNQALGLNP